MNRYILALQLFRRDLRAGELTLLIAALTIAIASSTSVSLFADRLQRTMLLQTAEFLAADLVIAGPLPIAPEWLDKADKLELKQAQTIEFSSVLMENDELLLVGVKAVSKDYPLRGVLKTTESDYGAETAVFSGPQAGQVWIEKRILSALKLNMGDPVTVGEKPLTISRILTYEPDQQSDFYSFSPRVMINADDLAATGILQPGSHVHYFFQFSGAEANLKAFNRWIKSRLNPSQRILDIHDDRPELGSTLDRAESFLNLANMIVIVIAGAAVAMATRRYSERHYDASALFRCLGARHKDTVTLFGIQFALLALLSGVLGCLFGGLAHQGLIFLLRPILPQSIADAGIMAYGYGFMAGVAVLFGFALPPVLRLQRVSALRVLRRDLTPLPASAWLILSAASCILCFILWLHTGDSRLTAVIFGIGSASVLLLALTLYGLLLLAGSYLPKLPLIWRYGLRNLVMHKPATIGQIIAFSLALTAMALSYSVRNGLVETWRKQVPERAPNHFALNIFPEQKNTFADHVKRQGIGDSQFFPIVRGRLIAVNDVSVQSRVVKNSQGEGATHRELSLTWTTELPKDNRIVDGNWWPADGKKGLVSMEKKLADSLNVHVADRLTFAIGSRTLHAEVASLRELQWATMEPNFYMIFSPGTLDDFASTYLTSFYLPDSAKNLLNALIKQFPSITILEVDRIIRQIQKLLAQLTEAINFMLYFALASAMTVLWASVHATLDHRINEGALMRSLGASRDFIMKTQWIEFSILGLISGLLAVFLSEVMIFSLYRFVLSLTYRPEYRLWLLIPLFGAILVTAAGCWGSRNVLKNPPLQVLRDW